jgi:hypothetical protein
VERYLSSVYDAQDTVTVDSVKWWGNFPNGTNISVELRAALDTSQWLPWTPVQNNQPISNPNLSNIKFLQYRISFLLDFKHTSLLSLDSIAIFYHPAEEPLPLISVYPDQQDSTDPNTTISYNIFVRNDGNYPDVIDISLYNSNPLWNISLIDSSGSPLIDNDGDGLPDVGTLPPNGHETQLTLLVTPPPNTQEGDLDTTIITGYSSIDTTIKDSAIIITKIRKWVSIIVEPNSSDSTEPGSQLIYHLYAKNRGNATDIPDLIIEGALNNWLYTLLDSSGGELQDSDNDGIPDLGPLQPGDSSSFLLSVIPPLTALPGTGDTVIVWGISSRDTLMKDGAIIRTYIKGGAMLFDLEENARGIVGPGGGKTYNLKVLEEGIYADTVELQLSNTPTNWETSLMDTSLNPIEDIDNDGWLELLPLGEGIWTPFLLKVVSGSIGDSLILIVKGRSTRFPELMDSVRVVTVVISRLHVHNYKSPFEKETTFFVRIPQKGYVWLSVYTRSGERVRKILWGKLLEPGEYEFPWDGKNERGEEVTPGIYTYVLEFEGLLGGKNKIIKNTIKLK